MANTEFPDIAVNDSQAATDVSVDSVVPFEVRLKRYLKQLAVRIFVYLGAYLIISIVAIGPFYWTWFGAMYANGPRWVLKFFAPLYWLCVYFPPLRWLVQAYIDCWP